MRPPILTGSETWPADGPRPVVTIGNFDGVHRGHQALLAAARTQADALGAVAVAYTFDPAPRDVLRPGNPILRLQRLEDRQQGLLDRGMDHVLVEPFTLAFAAHDATWFATEVLQRRLNAAAVVVGWDFRFGKGRGGNAVTLAQVLDIPVQQVPALVDGDGPISSSRIRQALGEGDVTTATRLLGRPYELVGAVVPGDARGRELGFPTANIHAGLALVPRQGVYAVRLLADGVWHDGVANLGERPTFGGGDPTIEVHLLDWRGDLYDKLVRVAFVARLRDERRFDGRDALVNQIRADVDQARTLLGP